MKIFLKASIKILVFCFALTLVNCEKDDEIIRNNNVKQESLFQFKVKAFNELNKNDKFKKAYNKAVDLSKNNSSSKTGMEETYGFIIDSSTVNELSSSNLTSYTMLIHREVLNPSFFENLVVEIDSLNQIEAYIIKYTYDTNLPTQYNEAHNAFGLNAFVEIIPIVYDASTVKVTCSSMYVSLCSYQGIHIAGDNCTQVFGGGMVTSCSGGANDGGNGQIGAGTNNGGDPVGNPDVYTAPVEPPTMAEQIADFIELGKGQEIWINKNKDKAEPIRNYLMINCGLVSVSSLPTTCVEAQAFALEAMEAIMDKTNDINTWEDFVADELINGMDKECQALAVFRSIYKINSTFTNKIKNYFLKSSDNNLYLEDWTTGQVSDEVLVPMPANVGARVLYRPSADGTLILQFNNTHLDTATTLGFINTFYHELVHAYILRLYYTGELLNEYPAYTDLKTAMDNFFNDDTNDTLFNIYDKEMHDIYVDFIDQLAESIVGYCDYNNINGVDLEYAEKLVWGGLNGYDVFFDNLTTPQQFEAQTLLAYENSNITANAKGTKTCD